MHLSIILNNKTLHIHCHLFVICHRLLRGLLERRKRLTLLLLIAFVGGLLFLSYYCPESLCTVSNTQSRHTQLPSVQKDFSQSRYTVDPISRNTVEVDLPTVDVEFSDEEVEQTFSFDADRDVLVFLHAQKTGGSTFERHLVRDTTAGVPAPCVCRRRRKRCDCRDSRGRQWLFSRFSSGWVCGLHADWTELHDCVPRYLDKHEDKKRQRRFVLYILHFLFVTESYTECKNIKNQGLSLLITHCTLHFEKLKKDPRLTSKSVKKLSYHTILGPDIGLPVLADTS